MKKKGKEKKERNAKMLCFASISFSHVCCYLPRGTVEVLRESGLQV